MKCVFYIIALKLILLPLCVQSQSYNCTFWRLIEQGIIEQNEKYQVYLTLKDSVRIKRLKNNHLKVINLSHFSDQKVDSMMKYCNFRYIFNDPLFNIKNYGIVIDTFNFFIPSCSHSHIWILSCDQFAIKSEFESNQIDTIYLKSIKTYLNNLVLAFQHNKSKYEVHFYFNLVANLPPKLEKILRQAEDPE